MASVPIENCLNRGVHPIFLNSFCALCAFLRLRILWRKGEGPDSAEPSLEGPVGKTTGNRPLINQFPVNPSVSFQNAGPGLGFLQACACKCSRRQTMQIPD